MPFDPPSALKSQNATAPYRGTAQLLSRSPSRPKADASETDKSQSGKPLAGFLIRCVRTAGQHKFASAIAATLLLVLAGVAISSTTNANAAGYVTAPVVARDLEQTVVATGVLEPKRLVSIGAQASGQIDKLYVSVGDEVQAGDPIADINATRQENSVKAAEAALLRVQADRASAAASLTQAEQEFARQDRLYAAGATSQADYETAQAQLTNAQASQKAIDAQITSANLTLSTAQEDLGYTRITAPSAGTIVAIVAEEGQTVNANQSAPTIVKLADLKTMTVRAEISEADVAKVEAGQTVYFTTLGDTQTRHYATLRAIEPAPQDIETTDSLSANTAKAIYYTALFDVDNADGVLRTWMTAQVYIVLASAEDALTIPSTALGPRQPDGSYDVQVVNENGEAETRQVTIGLNANAAAEVLNGLGVGERVVLGAAAERPATAQAGGARSPAGAGMMMGGGPPR